MNNQYHEATHDDDEVATQISAESIPQSEEAKILINPTEFKRDHIQINEPTGSFYLPQIGDQVAFIYQGYEDVMTDYIYYLYSNNLYDDYRRLKEHCRANDTCQAYFRVTDIQYKMADKKLCDIYGIIHSQDLAKQY